MPEYLALIDRPAHAVYVAAVAAALAAAAAPPVPIPFSEPLADAHDELQNAFNAHVAALRWDIVHVGAGANALNAAQTAKVASNVATLMKDCNTHLANATCLALSTPDMAAYHYLTSLDFVKDASGCKTNFGRIPQADVRLQHLQLFPKLAAELFKVGRLLGSSNNTYAIFTSPEIHLGLVNYTTQLIIGLILLLPTILLPLRILWIGSRLGPVSLSFKRRVSLLICLVPSRSNTSSATKPFARPWSLIRRL